MRLTSMTIKNFKGIGEKGVTINFAPITMLFGPNNAGKSTIIQALHLAREVFCEHEPDFDRVAVYGEGMNLGAFRDYVHGHDINNVVRIKLDFENTVIPNTEVGEYNSLQDSEMPTVDDIVPDVESFSVEFALQWNSFYQKTLLSEYRVFLNGKLFTALKFTLQEDGKKTYVTNDICQPEAFISQKSWDKIRSIPNQPLEGFDTHINGNLQDAIFDSIPPILHQFVNMGSFTREMGCVYEYEDEGHFTISFSLKSRNVPEWGKYINFTYTPLNGTREFEEFYSNFTFHCNEMFSCFISMTGKMTGNFLRKLLYIGPMREIPPRGIYKQENITHARWATGLAAWDVIAKANTAEMERLNKALSVLELNYSVVVESISNTAEDREELRKDAIEFIEQLKSTNAEEFTKESKEIFEAFSKAFNEGFAPIVRNAIQGIKNSQKKMHTFNRIVLKNNETSVTVEPQDMGLGVSQIIPFIVAATLAKRDSFIAVEQPELHIHPKLQVNLGDVVIQSALQSENKPIFLIETHSEHLLLRLLRRIRQTNEERAPEGLELAPEQVVINWIGAKDAQTYCLQLDIDEDGSFNTPWPDGFFDERGEEIFG